VEAAVRLGLDCVQVFTKNQRQWKVKPLADEEVAAFRAAVKAAGWDRHPERRLVSHNSYLVNLASPDAASRAKSRALQLEETERCERLGIPSCVMHPGAHLGTARDAKDEAAGIKRLAAELDAIHRATKGYATVTCIENTVGSGTNLGGPLEHLARIRAATRRMAQLIDDLLNLARVSRGELRCTEVDMSEMAQGVVDALREGTPGREVEVTIEPGLVARADPVLLRVVLENLLGNAWKFTGKHARAHISISRGVAPGSFVVRDDGAGFDMAYRDTLFGAFQRLHGQDEFEGTGIGLATVDRIVRRHGGRVWAEGAVEGGAALTFTLGEGEGEPRAGERSSLP